MLYSRICNLLILARIDYFVVILTNVKLVGSVQARWRLVFRMSCNLVSGVPLHLLAMVARPWEPLDVNDSELDVEWKRQSVDVLFLPRRPESHIGVQLWRCFKRAVRARHFRKFHGTFRLGWEFEIGSIDPSRFK
jgi:hypothetical protein